MKWHFSFVFSLTIIISSIVLFHAPNCLTENSNENIDLKHCCKDNCEKQDNWIDLDFSSKSISYRLEQGTVTCKELERRVELDITRAKYDKTNDRWNLPDLNENSTFSLGNGTIEVTNFGTVSPYELYPENNYCIKKFSNKIVHFGICCTERQPCVRKCCPPNEHILFESDYELSCKPDNDDGRSDLPKDLPKTQRMESKFNYITQWPSCGSKEPLKKRIKWPTEQGFKQSIGENGKLFRYFDMEIKTWRNISDSNDYCMDRVEREIESKVECHTKESLDDGILFLCPSESPELIQSTNSIKTDNSTNCGNKPGLNLYTIFYTFCFIIAMMFLLATATVKFLLWEKQNIHSWTILCYVMSLFFLYLSLIILYLQKSNSYNFKPGLCVFMGVVTHFLAFCAFSWLSVINFDLWWTFRVLTPVSESKQEFQRFLWYCGFAFLLPVVMISVSLSFHFTYKNPEIVVKCGKHIAIPHPSTLGIIYPRYGEESCFLSSTALLPYLYGPLGFLLLTNLIFYLTTTVRMFNLYKTSRRVSETSSKRQRQSCRLFLKLFVVAGLTWSSEIVYWLATRTSSKCSSSKWYWALLDMANIFQAIAIFVIFVCKKETVRSLEQKYPALKGSVSFCNAAIFGPIARFTRSPNFQDRSTDGSTKISRTELSKNGTSESIQKQESIELS